MTGSEEVPRVVSASREIAAGADRVFALIADPAQQPRWDGNDNLAEAAGGQRVRAVGDVFTTTLTQGSVRENHVVEFEKGRRIAWRPAEPGARADRPVADAGHPHLRLVPADRRDAPATRPGDHGGEAAGLA
jgi:uncharacterized protein YndB with AHSA1/START domain